ncbi:hypothetical protein C8F04DRAFT_1092834 [Mycena alexandri]|uniref:Alpha-type protein kinase domain-containing protein n=1 Tax=Mycena alexandri TaxID=1745969 RepID=A0AAD6T1R9_9AGAR|nr:hypothetical protein C8F04DRAFT_1092834 [Mycena alexandri]
MIVAGSSKHALEGPSTPPPSKKACLPVSPESPEQWSRQQMNSVLTKQTHATAGQLGALFKNKIVNAAVYPLKKFEHMNDLVATSRDWRTFCNPARVAILMFNTDPKHQMSGSFKMASIGESNPALFKDPKNFDICVKQTFYVSKGFKIGGSTVPANIAHDARAQAKSLTMEVRCLAWGHVLLYMVYTFIRRFIREHGEPPFPIPQMRFVEACLASQQEVAGAQQDLFLIEERIHPDVEGKFRKYINNGAAIPTAFRNAEDQERAQFLAFTQHVQYWKTTKTVFVGDYQGGNTLLTDPQIMSSPEFMAAGHHLFADGNVATGFESFEIDHVCNKFCQFFQLRTDYNNWNVEDDASGGFTKAMSISVGI